MKKIIIIVMCALGASQTNQLKAQSVPSHIPSNGLIGYYSMDNSGSNSASGMSDAQFTNLNSGTDRFGNAGKCYRFDGLTSSMWIDSAGKYLANKTSMSMSLWVLTEDSVAAWPNYRGFGGIRNNSNADFYLIQLEGKKLESRFRDTSGNENTIVDTTHLKVNQWQFFTLVKTNDSLLLYINGNKVHSVKAGGAFTDSGAKLYIGNLPYLGNLFVCKGNIDDVAIWDRDLSASEVAAIHTGSSTGLQMNTSFSLLSVYPNPFQNYVIIQNCPKGSTLELTDMQGKTILIKNNIESNEIIQTEGLDNGIYFLRLFNNEASTSFKLIH